MVTSASSRSSVPSRLAVQSEGRGWEYPVAASLGGFRADVRYEAAGAPLGW